jgi:hypothetical protein
MNLRNRTAVSAPKANAIASRQETSVFLAALDELRHALAIAAHKVLSCRRATHAEYSTLRGRMRAFHRVERAYDRLCSASGQLQRAVAALSAMIEAADAEPAVAARAPRDILMATQEFIRVSARIVDTSNALDAVVAFLEENPRSIAKPRPAPAWLYAQYPSDPLERIRLLLLLLRRRRTRCQATEDAPRRISRGRAPPFLSICSL